jgi:hypothetical protein
MSYDADLRARTFLKPSEVASFFNVSPQTVYFWHKMGQIHGIKICGSLRIYSNSLAGLLGSCGDGGHGKAVPEPGPWRRNT